MNYQIEKQKNGKFKVRVWSKPSVFGKRISKQVSNITGITAAKKLAKEISYKINETNNINTDKITFNTLEELYFEERKNKISPTTLHSSFKYNREKVKNYLGNLKIKDISTPIIQKFIDIEQSKGLRKKTVKNYVSYILAVINWGVNNDYIEYNKIKKLNYIDDDEEFEATTLNIEQISNILSKLKHDCYNLYIPTLITILTSARRGEVLGLKWKDIDFENNTIHFRKNLVNINGKPILKNKLKTKTSKRVIPMALFLKEELLKHKTKFTSTNISEQVCSNIFIGEITPDYLTHMLHDYILNNFNIDMREHDLRHNFSQLIEDNEDLLIEKSKMMGHSNLQTTKLIYTKKSFSKMERITNALGEMIRKLMCANKCAI